MEPETPLLLALAPGLLFVLLAGVFGIVSHRWLDSTPMRVWLIHLALVTLFFGQSLFLGWIQLPLGVLRGAPPFSQLDAPWVPGVAHQADVVEDFLPYSAAARRSLRQSEWPLLNPIVGPGEPLLANPQAQAFQPLHLATLVLPLERAAGVQAAMKVLLALHFSFLLCRRLGLHWSAALAGSVVYGLGGFTMMWLGWPHAHSAAALPTLLYALLGLAETGRWRYEALLLAATSYALLGGHPQTLVIVVAIAAAFAIPLLRTSHDERRLPALLVPSARAVGCAVLLAMPVLLPAAAWIDQTHRYFVARDTSTTGPTEAAAWWTGDDDRAREQRDRLTRRLDTRTATLATPLAFGRPPLGGYWGYQNPIEDGAMWAGSVALLATLTGLFLVVVRSRGAPLPGERFGVGLALASWLLALELPGLHQLLEGLPLFGRAFSNPSRFALGFALAASLLTATVLQRALDGRLDRRLLALAAVVAAVLSTWALTGHPPPEALGAPSEILELRARVLLLHLGVLAAATALLWRLEARAEAHSSPSSTIALSIVAIAALELTSLHIGYHRAMPRELYFPEIETTEFLQRHLDDERRAPHDLASYRMLATDELFRPNLPVLYGIADWRSANPVRSLRTSRLTAHLRYAGGRDARYRAADDALYDLLGIRYVVRRRWSRLPLERVHRSQVSIYRRPGALAVVWAPREAIGVPANQTWLATREHGDFASSAIVAATTLERLPARLGDGRATLLEVENSRLAVRLEMEGVGLVATRLLFGAGWRASLDGQPTPTFETNGAFVGLTAPEGRHRLDLVYRPPGFLAGCILGAVGWTLTLMIATSAAGRPVKPLASGPPS